MIKLSESYFRDQLGDRHARLVEAQLHSRAPHISRLLADVDAALDRLDRGTYGVCDVCHDLIDTDLLVRDPLARMCREHPAPEKAQRLAYDLELARDVQRRLLPPRDLVIQGWDYHYRYLAAGQVGGDYCDIIPVPSRSETLILVGDVSGKGVAASMLMAGLHATFRSLAPSGLPTGELLARVSALFAASAPPASYATLVAASLMPDGTLDLYSAGHWPPLVLRGGMVERLSLPPGLPLGMFGSSEYSATRLELGDDEGLFFYTDGTVDAEDASGQPYGAEGLDRALHTAGSTHPQVVVESCFDDFRRFAGNPTDDVTVLALRPSASARSRRDGGRADALIA